MGWKHFWLVGSPHSAEPNNSLKHSCSISSLPGKSSQPHLWSWSWQVSELAEVTPGSSHPPCGHILNLRSHGAGMPHGQWYLAPCCTPALPFSFYLDLAVLISCSWLRNTKFVTDAFAIILPLMLLLFCVTVKLHLPKVLPILSAADEAHEGLSNLLALTGEIAFYY